MSRTSIVARPRRTALPGIASLSCLALAAAATVATAAQSTLDSVCAQDTRLPFPSPERYQHRHGSTAPPGSIAPVLRDRTAQRLAFSPLVDAIVEEFSAADFDQRLRDLSGMNEVTIGGSGYTFRTRYTKSTGGQMSWQYAYEQLGALGLAVRYQDYVRSGNHYQNVIATIPGELTPERVYVLGGHIDSISSQATTLAPGAEDNGSGSSGVLASAAALAGHRFESTIELVLFSGEEQGLWGSQAYVNEALSLGVDIRGAVTMDMIAYYNNDYGVMIEGENAWTELMGSFGDAIDTYTSLDKQFSYYSWGSDHVPFQDANIPALLAIDLDWDEYPYYHSTQDTYDRTTPALGVEIARAALATIAQLAGPIESTSEVGSPLLTGVPVLSLRAHPNPASESVWLERTSGPDAQPFGSGPVSGTDRHAPRLIISDVSGRVVQSVPPFEAGPEGWRWNLRNEQGLPVAPGIYFARVRGAAARIVVIR